MPRRGRRLRGVTMSAGDPAKSFPISAIQCKRDPQHCAVVCIGLRAIRTLADDGPQYDLGLKVILSHYVFSCALIGSHVL